MFRRVLAVCLWLAVSSVTLGEETSTDVAAELRSIKEQLRALNESLTAMSKSSAAVDEQQDSAIAQLKKDAEALAAQDLSLREDIAKLRNDFQETTNALRAVQGDHEGILKAIAQKDSAGRDIPRLSAVMEESDDFRKEMEHAVNKSIATSGEFRIVNKTGQFQRIHVNRTEYSVGAGEVLTLKVPTGTVTTQIPGRELVNWTVGTPNYQQSIDIVPPSSPTPIYAPATMYVSPPVYYYDPWSYVGNVVYYWP